jgi:hypothetical protein
VTAKVLLVLASAVILGSESQDTHDHILLSADLRVKVTIRLAVYRQSVLLDAKPLEDHDQRYFVS